MKSLRYIFTLVLFFIFTCLTYSYAEYNKSGIITESVIIGEKPAHLIQLSMGKGRTGEVSIGTGKLGTVDKAQNHISRKNSEYGKSVVAAINGGASSIIQNGQLISGGGIGKKPAIGFTQTGEVLIDRVQIQVKIKLRSSVDIYPWSVNTWQYDPDAIMMFNSLYGKKLDIPSDCFLVFIEDDTVIKTQTGSYLLDYIPPGATVLVYNSQAYSNAIAYGFDPKPGNSAQILTNITPTKVSGKDKWNNMVTVLSAGPMLLMDGEDVSEQNRDFIEPEYQPDYVDIRSFAAITNEGELILGNANASIKELAQYLISIGAVDAMCLEGGTLSTLYAGGEYIASSEESLSDMLTIVDYSSGKLPEINSRSDVNYPSPWAKTYIDSASSMGLIPQKVNGDFKTNITRQDFCHMAANLLKQKLGESGVNTLILKTGISYEEASTAFKDAYHQDIINCYRLRIIDGKGNGIFDPNASMTRQEAAKILSSLCDILGIQPSGKEIKFNDAANISDWAASYVAYISKTGIMNGKGANFDPLGYLTRQEAVVTMLRLFNSAKT